MEVDVDDQDNEMEKFLRHKLNEIESATKVLQNTREKSELVIKQCSESLKNSASANKINVVKTWKKIHEGIAIHGFELENCCESYIIGLRLVLQWTSKSPLTYATKLMTKYKKPRQNVTVAPCPVDPIVREFLETVNTSPNVAKRQTPPAPYVDNEWVASDRFVDHGLLMVKHDVPSFAQQKTYDFHGIMTYQADEVDGQSSLPTFALDVGDLQDASVALRNTEVLLGNDQAFLAATFMYRSTEMELTFPHGNGKVLESYFQIHCMMDSIAVTSKSKWFYANNLGDALTGTMIQLKTSREVDHDDDSEERNHKICVFARNDHQLYAALHHLHMHIPGIVVRNSRTEEMFSSPPVHNPPTQSSSLSQAFFTAPSSSSSQRDAQLLGDGLDQQIGIVEKFCSSVALEPGNVVDFSKHSKDYVKFRCELSDMEKRIDLLLALIDTKIRDNE